MTEKREVRNFQVRFKPGQSSDPEFTLRGYAATFNQQSHPIQGFREVIKPGAFKKAIKEQQDVRCTFQHDVAKTLGRTTAGTLTLSEDDKGLSFRCQLDPKQQWHRDLHSACARGDYNEASFAFNLEPGDDDFSDGTDEDGKRCAIRTISNFSHVYDIALVASPAYPGTRVSARALNGTILDGTMADAVARARQARVATEQILFERSPVEQLSQRSRLKMLGVRIKIDNRIDEERKTREAEKERRVDDAFAAVKRGNDPFDEDGEVNDCTGGSMAASKADHEKASGEHLEKAKRCFKRGEKDLAEMHYVASDAHAKATSGEYANLLQAQCACSRCWTAGQS